MTRQRTTQGLAKTWLATEYTAGKNDVRVAQPQRARHGANIRRKPLRMSNQNSGIRGNYLRQQGGDVGFTGAVNPIHQLIRRVQTEPLEDALERTTGTTSMIETRDLRLKIGKGQSVSTSVIAEQMSPTTGARGLTGGVTAYDNGPGAADNQDTGLIASERGSQAGVKIVAGEDRHIAPGAAGEPPDSLPICLGAATRETDGCLRGPVLSEQGKNLAVGGELEIEGAKDTTTSV